MTATEILTELRSKGAIVEGKGDRLIIDAPKGVLTDKLRQDALIHKWDILSLVIDKQLPACPFEHCRLQLMTIDFATYRRYECPTGHFMRFTYKVPVNPEDDFIVDHQDESVCRANWKTIKAWVNQLGTMVCSRCFPPQRPSLVEQWIEIVPLDYDMIN